MQTDVILISSGIHGREMVEIIRRTGKYNLLGIVRITETTEQISPDGIPILGGLSVLSNYPDTAVMCDNEARYVSERLISLIDPTAFVHPSAVIGKGCVVYPNCFIGAEAVLGESCFLLTSAVVNHNCTLGNRVIMATGAHLAGSVKIDDNAYIGQDATIRQFTTVGKNALIGMGAVVVKPVPDNAVMVGNPAKLLRMI